MALDATLGGTSANSYVTVAEADDYFSTSFGRTSWSSTISDNKEIVLIESTRLLDLLVSWKGYVKSDTQALRWPRTYVPNIDGPYNGVDTVIESYISDSIVPKDVKNAVFELAYSLLSNGGFQSSENELSKVQVGPVSIDFSETVKSNGLPKIVRDMIARWGEYTVGSSNSVHTVGLLRT
jgi:hypothetical protein